MTAAGAMFFGPPENVLTNGIVFWPGLPTYQTAHEASDATGHGTRLDLFSRGGLFITVPLGECNTPST